MKIAGVRNCCTGKIIFNFGETSLDGANFGLPKFRKNSKKSIIKYINEQVEIYKHSMAFIMAITNSEQFIANEALEELGFSSSGWMEKEQHPETMVKLWFYPLKKMHPKDFKKAVEVKL
jgi:hypothetical protein